MPLIFKASLLERVEEEKLKGTGEPRFRWKMVVIRICEVGELKRIMNNNNITPV